MRADKLGGAPSTREEYRGVVKRVKHGDLRLTSYGGGGACGVEEMADCFYGLILHPHHFNIFTINRIPERKEPVSMCINTIRYDRGM